MEYKKLWTDLHSNIHHDQMKDLQKWIDHARLTLDFWPVAYYPFHIKRTETGAGLEDLYEESERNRDWEQLRDAVTQENENGFPMFMGYEWQGAGLDGDHNVFFLENDIAMKHPMDYKALQEEYRGTEAIAIPHHVAYELGSRGKNWDTNDEAFSPFAEIYSSHGCSENDTGPFDMERHLHMGPRTGETCFERALEKGIHIGMIASGDNHSNPAVYDHGTMCVLADDSRKESIWEGLKSRRVYGVSRSRMDIDFSVNGAPMGAVIKPGTGLLKFKIRAADAIDRVEILKGNILETMVVHSGTWEETPLGETIRVKFALEFGWGPNPRFYQDILTKKWHGSLRVPGRICSIEKCFNSFGQRLNAVSERSCEFDLTTYMSTATGHWMGPSAVMKEGFVFEVEGSPEDEVVLDIDHYTYRFKLRELLKTSRILAQYQESVKLAEEVYGDVSHYRDDFYWHNAYKTRIRQAVPESAYTLEFEKEVNLLPGSCYRLRVWLKNGDAAWVSPVFIEE